MPLNIVVLIKHIYDEYQLKVDQTTGEVDFKGVPGKISNFDRNSMETALRIRQKTGGSITTLTIGPQESEKSIREALAMGADKGVFVKVQSTLDIDAYHLSRIMLEVLNTMKPWDLLVTAEGGADTYTSVLPAIIAHDMSLPYLSYLNKVDVTQDGFIIGERMLERKMVQVKSSLPAIISVLSEIYEPRIPTLLQIMSSSKKELKIIPFDAKLYEEESYYKVQSLSAKGKERKKIIFEGSPQETALKLVESLVREGVI